MGNRIRIVFAGMLITGIVLAGASTLAYAGETEYEVISEALIVTDYDTGTVEEAEAVYDNLIDIYLDTEPGSYCETYAAAAAFSAHVMVLGLQMRDSEGEDWTPEIGVTHTTWFNVVVPEIEAVGTRCQNEE